jgi:hypothetical protein
VADASFNYSFNIVLTGREGDSSLVWENNSERVAFLCAARRKNVQSRILD